MLTVRNITKVPKVRLGGQRVRQTFITEKRRSDREVKIGKVAYTVTESKL